MCAAQPTVTTKLMEDDPESALRRRIAIPLDCALQLHANKNFGEGGRSMKVFCACGIGPSFALALNSATLAAPDISGTYWATSYSPAIQVLGGGDPPLNAAGKAAYEMNQAGLKDGSIVDKAR